MFWCFGFLACLANFIFHEKTFILWILLLTYIKQINTDHAGYILHMYKMHVACCWIFACCCRRERNFYSLGTASAGPRTTFARDWTGPLMHQQGWRVSLPQFCPVTWLLPVASASTLRSICQSNFHANSGLPVNTVLA